MRRPLLFIFSIASGLLIALPPCARTENLAADGQTTSVSRAEIISPKSVRKRYEKEYRRIWKAIRDNYYDRDKLIGWDQWEHRYDDQLLTAADLKAALKKMCNSLGDDYTYVLSKADMKERDQQAHLRHVVSSKKIDGNVGYLRLRNFASDDMEDELEDAMAELSGVDGYVLDLRNNHGGYVNKARELFAMLADKGVFVTYIGYQDGTSDARQITLNPKGWDIIDNGSRSAEPRHWNKTGGKPLVLLVNEDTRSAAEMLAGALRENERAAVVGTKTFGKGVLQNTFNAGEGLLVKVTTARYFLPNGESIHNKGVQPDIVVPQKDSEEDEQLKTALSLLQQEIASVPDSRRRAEIAGLGLPNTHM